MNEAIQAFLAGGTYAVAGASHNREKYGNRCLRALQQADKHVVAIHPQAAFVEGASTYRELKAVPHHIDSLSIVTPPSVTERIVDEAIAAGVKNIWMQPGAESEVAITAAEDAGINVIAGGPCLLVALRFHDV